MRGGVRLSFISRSLADILQSTRPSSSLIRKHEIVETGLALLHRRTAAPWPLFMYMYNVQFPAIKACLCIEINQCCHSCRSFLSLHMILCSITRFQIGILINETNPFRETETRMHSIKWEPYTFRYSEQQSGSFRLFFCFMKQAILPNSDQRDRKPAISFCEITEQKSIYTLNFCHFFYRFYRLHTVDSECNH